MEARKTPWLTLVVVVVVLAGAFLYYQQFNNYRLKRDPGAGRAGTDSSTNAPGSGEKAAGAAGSAGG